MVEWPLLDQPSCREQLQILNTYFKNQLFESIGEQPEAGKTWREFDLWKKQQHWVRSVSTWLSSESSSQSAVQKVEILLLEVSKDRVQSCHSDWKLRDHILQRAKNLEGWAEISTAANSMGDRV